MYPDSVRTQLKAIIEAGGSDDPYFTVIWKQRCLAVGLQHKTRGEPGEEHKGQTCEEVQHYGSWSEQIEGKLCLRRGQEVGDGKGTQQENGDLAIEFV